MKRVTLFTHFESFVGAILYGLRENLGRYVAFEVAWVPHLLKEFDELERCQLRTSRLIKLVNAFVAELEAIISYALDVG